MMSTFCNAISGSRIGWMGRSSDIMASLGCRFREKKAMAEAKEKFKEEIERFIALQYIFDKQWKAVRVSDVHTHAESALAQAEHHLRLRNERTVAPARVKRLLTPSCVAGVCQLEGCENCG